MRVPSRQATYVALRGSAALGVVGSATLMPTGGAAGLICLGSGLLAIFTCIGVNAGAPGEQAGADAQGRALARIMPPQGDWPPYATAEGAVPRVPATQVADRPHR